MGRDNEPSTSLTPSLSPIDDLFELARYGRISGDEADAEAVRLGLGSLSVRPGPTEFLPENMPHWSLVMALAWIAYRQLDVVRAWSAAYRAECIDWKWRRWRIGPDGPVHEGWHLEVRAKPNVPLLTMNAKLEHEAGDGPQITILQAKKALWRALEKGQIVANGIDTETHRRADIAAIDWHELVLILSEQDMDEVRRGHRGSGFRDVLLPAEDLRSLWRPQLAETVQLPPTMPPTGDGFMPLYCAAQWIATAGGKKDVDAGDRARWKEAFDALLAAISSDRVRVVGLQRGERRQAPGHLFAGIRVNYPFDSKEFGMMDVPELHLRSYPYLDDDHWRGGFDDALVLRGRETWQQLMVDKAEIRALWPFDSQHQVDNTLSGFSGRPGKSKHLIDDEFERRAAAGLLAPTAADEARALLDWFVRNHPDKPRPVQRTIRNNILKRYRQFKGTK